MGKFTELIEREYQQQKEDGFNENITKGEFLSQEVFDFTTYDTYLDIVLCYKMIEVLKCLVNKSNLEYIKVRDQYINYITMVNMPFLVYKIEWGTSIRGACLSDSKEYKILDIEIKQKELTVFIKDLIEWLES